MNWLIKLWYRIMFRVICGWLPRLQGKTMLKSEVVCALLPGKPGWVIPVIYKISERKK